MLLRLLLQSPLQMLLPPLAELAHLCSADCVPLSLYLPSSVSLSIYININILPLSLSLYIYICCEVIIWAKFGHFRCYYLGQVGVIIWAKLFLAYENSGFKRFLRTQLSFCVFFLCPIIWQLSKNSLFQKKGAKIGFFNYLCFKFKM